MTEHKDFFSNRIEKSLLGPGSDVFAVSESEEILSDYPLQRYYTGILFPEKTISSPDEELPEAEKKDDTEEDFNASEDDTTVHIKKTKEVTDDEGYVAANQYFPTNCGMTICLKSDIQKLEIEITGATYKLAKPDEVKIGFTESEHELLFSLLTNDLKDRLKFDEGKLFFNQRPKGKTQGTVTEDYAIPRELRKKDELKNSVIVDKFERLLTPDNRLWKRFPFKEPIEINLKKDSHQTVIEDGDKKLEILSKIINDEASGIKYLKLLLYNASKEHPQKSFTNSNEKLNSNCFYQVKISVVQTNILPYKQPSFSINQFDKEANLVNYQYRSVKEYAIGHGCAIQSQKDGGTINVSTTFLPEVNMPMISNQLKDNPFFLTIPNEKKQRVTEVLNLKNLTIWSKINKEGLLQELKEFVSIYGQWIEGQKESAKTENNYRKYSGLLIKNQENAYKRLLSSIELLQTNKMAFECFQYANTAMYIQLITSTDERFAKKYKELNELKENIYDCLDFFKEYQDRDRDGNPFALRPFQLAFFLLNLNSIVRPEKKTEREVVDLLWFPTGGGKTEAYLAVTAFSILWRRMIHPDNYQGVSVIMRYTLRLLTAQQFERASRLICALEFLRSKIVAGDNSGKKKPSHKFGRETISIGMWVGSATTPNSRDEAKKVHKEIEDAVNELNKGKSAYPEEKNNFQIEACSWCGCKTITKHPKTNKHIQAFNDHGIAKCLNDSCHFSELNNSVLPIYVVDDYLYQNPPTLLFATVDKFAMLSHKSEGHRFFNSKDEYLLPPDLIIQDELHLLNGPLGSIVGLFERIIEVLCTKNGIKPKIIASTATTRNTELQIRNLYNRDLAVFPPAGIHYNDSFFAFTLKKSRRKYIGFMPTGKTGMDTQLKFLSHLLYARAELLEFLRKEYGNQQDLISKELDQYYTIVSYYNSLKDVGKTYNKVNAEVYQESRRLLELYSKNTYLYDFMNRGLISRTRELTSRIPSNQIKPVLNELETELKITKDSENGSFKIERGVDLVLASNMISVGIDVGRLNLMLINGQPRNVAEYIQASSRVARSNDGIVFNLLDSNRAREKSYFENYQSFHKSYYKFVEPLSLTPNTEITFDKMLNTMLVCYVRHIQGLEAHQFTGDISNLANFISQTIRENALQEFLKEKLQNLADDWLGKIKTAESINKTLRYNGNNQALISKSNKPWDLMYSMREIDKQSLILIQK
ncbi:MAG: helicase-related protein [Bacteroidetes bacterium]|nr:helicase-related protein [Bacteroidota bacterium]